MKAINDRIRAKRLLAAREHKFRIIPFLRHNALSYGACAILIAVILLMPAFYSLWSAFGCVVSFVLGMLFVYVRWLHAQRSVWPFAMRIINWESVQQLAEDAPQA